MLEKIKKHKKSIVASISTCLSTCFCTGLVFANEVATTVLGDSLEGVKNTFVSESNGITFIAIVILIIVCGVCVLTGNRKMAISLFIGGLSGILFIKYAVDIATMVDNGI